MLGGLKTINLTNIHCLREFDIYSMEKDGSLEISDVPNLSQFHYISLLPKPLPLNTSSLGSVTHITDNAFFNVIKLKIPFLQSLTLWIGSTVRSGKLGYHKCFNHKAEPTIIGVRANQHTSLCSKFTLLPLCLWQDSAYYLLSIHCSRSS